MRFVARVGGVLVTSWLMIVAMLSAGHASPTGRPVEELATVSSVDDHFTRPNVSAAVRAVEHVAGEPAAFNALVDLSPSGEAVASVGVGGRRISISAGGRGRIEHRANESVTQTFVGVDRDTLVTMESTKNGLRSLVQIDSVAAPEEFIFEIGGAVARLEKQLDGSVVAYDADGTVMGFADVPWAVDARGGYVETQYEIRGTALVQKVQHRSADIEYPVVADPDFIYLARCGAAIAIFAASNGSLAGKIAKVVGNAAKFYKKLKKFKSKKAAIKSIAYELSGAKGLDDMISKCWP